MQFEAVASLPFEGSCPVQGPLPFVLRVVKMTSAGTKTIVRGSLLLQLSTVYAAATICPYERPVRTGRFRCLCVDPINQSSRERLERGIYL